MTNYRVSADIGGTFTDFVVEEDSGHVYLGKVPTTPDNPARGVIQGIKELIPNPSNIQFFVHGTTVGLNAFLERRGERVLLVMTKGISDTYTIARGPRLNLYELQYTKPDQLVPRRDVFEVNERIGWDGEILEPLHEEDFQPIIDRVREEGINAVAVCLLHAYAYPEHELHARTVLEQALPGVSISLSHEVAREWREYERASSTVMNAYIAPVVERYLGTLKSELVETNVETPVHIMQSSGGVMTAEAAQKRPVFTLLSGPVGGTIAGAALSKASGRPNLLCVDMGGTSFDLSLVVDGIATTTLETELEGLPLLMSIVDIQTIGTGGGSIAWSENGAMRVGPHSAGSVPGPVCYGRGGTEPTVTDANLFLGRLGAGSLLSGEMQLAVEETAAAIEKKATDMGMTPTAYAEGILSISNAAMADAMRTITVQQGVDPRDFALVAFGGAGPMAAVFLARELDIGDVVIPRFPGTFSAWGMLQTDIRHDFTKNFFTAAEDAQINQLNNEFELMENKGKQALSEEQIEESSMIFQRSADMRYQGQEFSINVSISPQDSTTDIVDAFHQAHLRRHGHSAESSPVEFVNLRVAAFGELTKYQTSFVSPDTTEDPIIGSRLATFDGQQYDTKIIRRDLLKAGDLYESPLVVEEQSATTVVPPNCTIELDTLGNIIVKVNNND